MPYKRDEFPPSYKNLDPATRAKAVAMLNAMLSDGMVESKAIPMALAKAHEAMKEMRTLAFSNAIRSVEIFAPGTHNGEEYTEQDVDDMVAAAAKLDFRPAIKIGHTKDAPGAPAYGYVENIRKAGGKLVADLTDMHDSVVDAIRSKAYDRLSSEIYMNLKRGGQTFRRALKAVALLGAEVPAVANLVPLHKMEFAAAAGEYEAMAERDQDLNVADRALLRTLEERLAALTQVHNEHKETSDMDIKELRGKIKELSEKVTALKASDAKDKDEKIAALSEQLAMLAAEAEKLGGGEELARQLKAEQDARKADQTRIAQLEQKDREREATIKTEALKIPALRPAVKALYTFGLEHPEAKIAVFTVNDKKQEVREDIGLVPLLDRVVTELNGPVAKLFVSMAGQPHGKRQEEALDEKASDEVVRKVKEYQHAHPDVKKYSEAEAKVLEADAGLAGRYQDELGAKASARIGG